VDVFNIGAPESLLLLALALALFGPEELLRLAHQAGKALARLKRLWDEAVPALTQSLGAEQEPPQEADDAGPSTRAY